MKASTTSQAISPLIARTSQDTVHWITCRALSRLRRGSDQHPSKVIQCSRSRPKSLAYSSVRIRCGLALLHVSILPSCFQSFQSSSICQRKRIRATTCRAESSWLSTLVSTSSHSNWRCLLALTLWRGPSSLARLAARPWLGPSSTALDALAAGTPFHFALGSALASSKDLFRQAQGDQAHRHLLPLARSYPHLDHLLTLRQTA